MEYRNLNNAQGVFEVLDNDFLRNRKNWKWFLGEFSWLNGQIFATEKKALQAWATIEWRGTGLNKPIRSNMLKYRILVLVLNYSVFS